MNGESLAGRAIGCGLFVAMIVALNVGSYLLGCGTFFY